MKLPAPQSQIVHANPYKKSAPLAAVAKQQGISLQDVACLASNENPFGMSPNVLAILANQHNLNRYPDGSDFIESIAQHHAISIDNVILGNGSNDVLDMIARVFLGDETEAISSQYGFAIYRLLTQLVGATNIVAYANEYGHDLTAMTKAITNKTRVIWIANPNNPTGTFAPWDEVKKFLQTVPSDVVVVLDQAYNEYLEDSQRTNTTSWLRDFPNLIITYTFSKAYGLAGLRVGYGLASPEIIELLNRVRQPFNVNAVAIEAAQAALADQAFVLQTAQQNQTGKAQLESGLTSLGIPYIPSFGNFVTTEFNDADKANETLQKAGILIRPLKEYGLPNHLRISIGTKTEIARVLKALTPQ